MTLLGAGLAAQQHRRHVEQPAIDRVFRRTFDQEIDVAGFILFPRDAFLLVGVEDFLGRRERRLVVILGAQISRRKYCKSSRLAKAANCEVLLSRTSINRRIPARRRSSKNSAALFLVKPIVWISTRRAPAFQRG